MEEVKAEVKQEPDMISKAEKIAADLKVQLDRQEQLIAKERLSGRSTISAPVVEKSDYDKNTEFINKTLAGTNFKPLK